MTDSAAPTPAFEARDFRDALGAFATGVTVVTAIGDDGPVGLTTNAVTSVSLEPSMFLVCLANSSRTLPVVEATRRVAVSVLAADQEELAKQFASKHDPARKFHGIRVRELDGVPVIDGAAAVFVGSVTQMIPAGDHQIALCLASAVEIVRRRDPLLFHHGVFSRLT